jgi:DNA ligase D-like protein (predicted 3'-phosphoesterase)
LATRRGMTTRRASPGSGVKRAAKRAATGRRTGKTSAKRPTAKAGGRSAAKAATKVGTKAGTRHSAKTTARKSVAKSPSARVPTGAKQSAGAKPLAEYNAKRDFTRTREPAGTVPRAKGKTLHFVIQKHEASHLHYDFRLELDGVMKSWAVPKGPSYDPGVRRLAMEVEDHPISYNTFEGTIPSGEYGGGTVMLWDRGTYEAEDAGGVESLRRGYEKGDLKIVLHGKRLRGGWVLVRMKRPGRPQWLLIKHRDDHADPDRDVTAEEVTSVATKRTMEQIASGRRVWHSNR